MEHEINVLLCIISAVVFAEILKLGICVVLVMNESGSIKNGVRTMYTTVILNIKDTLRVCVPSFLYVIQNNLLYVSASNLDAATYQVITRYYIFKVISFIQSNHKKISNQIEICWLQKSYKNIWFI